jgi:nicotinamide mononucleotide transporter
MNIENLKKSFQQLKPYEWLMAAIMITIAAWSMISAFSGGSGGGSNPPWLTVVNFISAICGVFCIFLCAHASISNFAFGLVNTIVYMIFLWYHKIYGTFTLEAIIYLPFNIVSWIIWSRNRDNFAPEKTMVRKLNWKIDCLVITIIILAACLYHFILVKVGGTVPWLDAFTLSIGVIATALEMLRYREQYWLWVIQDIIAVAMYIMHFDAVYLTKKSIYLIMAIIGTYRWIKLQREHNPRNI